MIAAPGRILHTALPERADLFCKLALASGVLLFVLELAYLWACRLPYDPVGYLVGHDFVNTWMGARIALTGDPSPWFDFKTYNEALQATWGAGYPQHIWSYPPHVLLFTWVFGLIPYLPSLMLWTAIGLGVYFAAAVDGASRAQNLLLIVSPAVAVNIFTGQNGCFTAALLIGGLVTLDRRPILAGILFGILTIKPQLGILLPLMLVLTGRWRTIAAAAATAGVLAGVTGLVFGPGVWSAYRDIAMPHQTHAFLHGTGLFVSMMPTMFMNARAAALPLAIGWGAQAAVSACAVAAVLWTYSKPRDPTLSLALLITATFMATPYIFTYDMVIFGWVIARLVERPDNSPIDYVLMLAIWTLPVTAVALGLAGIPGSALVFAAFAGRLVLRLGAERLAQSPQAAPAL